MSRCPTGFRLGLPVQPSQVVQLFAVGQFLSTVKGKAARAVEAAAA